MVEDREGADGFECGGGQKLSRSHARPAAEASAKGSVSTLVKATHADFQATALVKMI